MKRHAEENVNGPRTSKRRMPKRPRDVVIPATKSIASSSTQSMHSHLKLNLDDNVGQKNITKRQPILNTSTPTRKTPLHSPSRILSKNVSTSNGLRIKNIVDQSQKKLSESHKPDLVDGTQHIRLDVMNSANEVNAAQPMPNLLQDSAESSEPILIVQTNVSMANAATHTEGMIQVWIQEASIEDHDNMKIVKILIEPNATIANQNLTVEVSKITETVTEETMQSNSSNYSVDSSAILCDCIVQEFSHSEHSSSSCKGVTYDLDSDLNGHANGRSKSNSIYDSKDENEIDNNDDEDDDEEESEVTH